MGYAVALLVLLAASGLQAQVFTWKLGGSGLPWAGQDSAGVLIDYRGAPGAIQPVYLDRQRTVFSYLSNWSALKIPRELGYEDGLRPRTWKWGAGGEAPDRNGTYLVDGDSTTYNPPSSDLSSFDWYTIDVAVPVPAFRFGFFTPSQGFRSDGVPLRDDIHPAYEVSIAAAGAPAWLESNQYQPVGQPIARIAENFDRDVHIDFPRQYVRFVRWKRNPSVLDPEFNAAFNSIAGVARTGSIGDFELFAEGVPGRVAYLSRIVDLGRQVNFGRLFWKATPLRRRGGQDIPADGAAVGLQVEVRSGRDADPDIYHEYDDKGREVVVSRQRYEKELKPTSDSNQSGIGSTSGLQRPGIRASIAYDAENWSFWSSPLSASGHSPGLGSGSHLQLRIALLSEDFDAFMRLDSLWIETAPLLAARVLGEVTRLDAGEGGSSRVELGRRTEFACAIRATFEAAGEEGFDALRLRTGGQTRFLRLEMGDPLRPVEARQVRVEGEHLVVLLPRAITRDHNPPLRLVFSTAVFLFATTFDGEVFKAGDQTLPQPIQAGDASPSIGTSSLRVLGAAQGAPALLHGLAFSTPVLTPNGDGAHDRLEISYALFRLPEAVPVQLSVYSLDGRRLTTFEAPAQTSGPQRLFWDGRDQRGALLPPGLYLVEVALRSQVETFRQVRPLGIAY